MTGPDDVVSFADRAVACCECGRWIARADIDPEDQDTEDIYCHDCFTDILLGIPGLGDWLDDDLGIRPRGGDR